ncbi:TPA: hypothetical protein ACH3X1_007835 [Trebouxia sp. C0004]
MAVPLLLVLFLHHPKSPRGFMTSRLLTLLCTNFDLHSALPLHIRCIQCFALLQIAVASPNPLHLANVPSLLLFCCAGLSRQASKSSALTCKDGHLPKRRQSLNESPPVC